MPHDGQDIAMTPTILPDLLTLTGATIAPLDALLERATATVKEQVTAEGRVSGQLVEQHQYAAHGLSWLATYVYSLRQMQRWAEALKEDAKFGEMEQLLHQIAFGEYLAQISGGIQMNQGEIIRLQDLGLSGEATAALLTAEVQTLIKSGNSPAARGRLVELIQEQGQAAIMFGASGL